MVTFTAYTPAGVSQGTLSPASADWDHRQAEDGFGRMLVNGDVAAGALGETVIIRVNDGTADRFAFVSYSDQRRQLEDGSEVDLSGPGVRNLLHAGQVKQEDSTDCALPADTRWFGWMSDAYDDSGWSTPETHGTWRSQPFPTARPENWPAGFAQYLWSSTDYDLGEEDALFRQTFNVSDEQDVVLCISADDEYECWLDGTQLPIGTYGGNTPFRWEDFDQYPVKLCAGDHTFAVRGRNLARPTTNQNPAWVIWAFVEVAGDGSPAAANQVWNVTTDATGGTFTIRPINRPTAATIDYNETAADFQTALEAVLGAGNIDVSGSGGDWTLEFIGQQANLPVPIVLDGTNLTGGTVSKSETQRGGGADVIAQSNTSDVVYYDPTSGEPGMTPGHILKVCMDEARARGTTVLDNITDGYSATLDSKGNAWGFELNLPVPLPASIHRVAVLLEEQGIDVWMDPDLTLQASDEQGTDDTASTTFAVGAGKVSHTGAMQEESTVRNVVQIRTDKGWGEDTDAASITARGRWESGIVLEGFQSLKQAEPHTNLLLNDLATPQKLTRFEIPSEASVVPYAGFGLGDRVNAPVFGTSGFDTDDVRVIGISGRLEEHSIVWTVEVVN